MKVRNIMFSGFAAAILMGTANAATTPFEIASKAYVDAQVRGATSNVGDTIGDMTTLQNGEGSNIGDGTDNVVDALNDLDDAIDTKQDDLVTTGDNANFVGSNGVQVTESNGVITTSGVAATSSSNGVMKLYTTTGSNTDGTMDQNSITTELGTKADTATVGQISSLSGFDNDTRTVVGALNELKGDINSLSGGAGSVQDQIDNALGDDFTGDNPEYSDVTAALADKQDKSDSTTGSDTYNYIASSSSAVATNLGTLDTNLKRVDDAVGSYDASTGTGTGLAKDVADIQSALTDQTTGLTPRVEALENTVGDSTAGLVKDVDDLQDTMGTGTLTGFANGVDTVIAALNDLQANKLNKPIPNTCSANSQHCVLHMDNTGALSWVDVTSPWTVESGSGSGSEEPSGN